MKKVPSGFYCLVLACLIFFSGVVSVSSGAEIVEGVSDYQVFPAEEYQGSIPFKANVTGTISAYVANSSDATPVVSQRWEIDPAAPPVERATQSGGVLRTSSKNLTIDKVPIGGQYDIIFEHNGQRQHISPVSVGQIWVVAGGDNAMGAPVRYIPEPQENVTVYHKNEGWQKGLEPLFPNAPEGNSLETVVSPWLRAAQQFYKNTGIPVGLVPWAETDLKMEDVFGEKIGKHTYSFQNLVKDAGKHANLLCWYQGEADANRFSLANYRGNMNNMARQMREWTDNQDMRILIIQTGRYMDPDTERVTPYFGRVRHQQYDFARLDAKAVIIPSMQYEIRPDSKYLLSADGVRELSQDVERAMTEWQKSEHSLWYGPRPRTARFEDSGRRRVKIQFDSKDRLLDIPDEAKGEFLIKDDKHLGYPEIVGFGIQGNYVALQMENARSGPLRSQPDSNLVIIELSDAGFLECMQVSMKGSNSLIMNLKQPADQQGSRIYYGLMDNAEAVLRDKEGRYVPAFGGLEIR